MEPRSSEPLFLINTVKARSGLSGRQIRYYESKGIICPQRTAGNQRIFSLDDLEMIEKLLDCLAQGMNLEAAARKLKDEEKQYYRQNLDPPAQTPHEAGGAAAVDSLYPVTDAGSLVNLIIQRRKG